ncbi:MAG: SRPBCC family protein [Actinomycetes bacterium]
MATVRRTFEVAAQAESVWDAVRDVGNVHTRLAPGVVSDCRLDGRTRRVTFANGLVLTEQIVTIDDTARRLAYTSVSGSTTHHHASVEVLPRDTGSRVVWTTDLIPDDLADMVGGLMDAGVAAMSAVFDAMAPESADQRPPRPAVTEADTEADTETC